MIQEIQSMLKGANSNYVEYNPKCNVDDGSYSVISSRLFDSRMYTRAFFLATNTDDGSSND